jgi:hypothetical protein
MSVGELGRVGSSWKAPDKGVARERCTVYKFAAGSLSLAVVELTATAFTFSGPRFSTEITEIVLSRTDGNKIYVLKLWFLVIAKKRFECHRDLV